ncbi:MAG: hypothetical protein ACLFPF_06505 [Halanaerobiales bacterium]
MSDTDKRIKYENGIYLLEICLEDAQSIIVGKLSEFKFPAGYFYYVGSAQIRMESRIKRHLQSDCSCKSHLFYFNKTIDRSLLPEKIDSGSDVSVHR